MHSGDFSEENKKKLKTLEKKYKQCSINLIDMKDMFKEGTKYNTRIPAPAYYWLILSDLLPNIDKIIYLDGDAITYIDIKEMYDLDMENYYYKGYRVWSRKFNHKFINNYICSGVLLINLKELRKNNITQQYYKFIKEKGKKLIYHDESLELLLNLVLEKVFIQSKKKYML